MHAYQLSYWDAQIWAVAHLNQVPVILNENIAGQSFIEGIAYKNLLKAINKQTTTISY